MVSPRSLYRALRQEEIEAHALIPRSLEPFVRHPQLPIGLPFTLGEREEHAVRAHQIDSSRYRTRGVSTTPHYHRALYYASRRRVIARIDRRRTADHGVRVIRVSDHVRPAEVTVPEDDEIILVSEGDGRLPPECIERLIRQ